MNQLFNTHAQRLVYTANIKQTPMNQIPNTIIVLISADNRANGKTHLPCIPCSHKRSEIICTHGNIKCLFCCNQIAIQHLAVDSKNSRNAHCNFEPQRRRCCIVLCNLFIHLLHRVVEIASRIVPQFCNCQLVVQGIQAGSIFPQRKIHIPCCQLRRKELVQNLCNDLGKRFFFQPGNFFCIISWNMERRKATAVRCRVRTQAPVDSISVLIVSGCYIQHRFITPNALFQKMLYTVFSSKPRARRRSASKL